MHFEEKGRGLAEGRGTLSCKSYSVLIHQYYFSQVLWRLMFASSNKNSNFAKISTR